jgi:hypothetical protein
MRNFCAGLLAVALLASTAAYADNNTGVCVALEAQLAQLDRGPVPGQDPRQYEEPIAQQQGQLDQATDQAHSAGCIGGFLFFKPRPDPSCGRLMAAIAKMQANLQRLQQAQAQLGGDSYAAGQQRNALLRQLADNRCAAAGGIPGQGPIVRDEGGNFLRDLFGGNIFQPDVPDNASGTGYGTYRTLCVRTCDGYYFPLSFSTVPSQFGTDAATCQSMCPGAEVELYTYRNPGEDVSQMVSLTGQPYSALPTAFKYRSTYDKACTCHSANQASIASGNPPVFTEFPVSGDGLSEANTPALGAPAPVVVPPGPNLRPKDIGEDPATVADRAGGLVPGPVAKVSPSTVKAGDDHKNVRIVGPNYYYGQQN